MERQQLNIAVPPVGLSAMVELFPIFVFQYCHPDLYVASECPWLVHWRADI